MKNNHAFTLTEILVVVVLLGVIAAFAIPNYAKSQRTAMEADAVRQLKIIYAANQIYFSKQNYYYSGCDVDTSIDDLNNGLGINLIENDLVYTYCQTSSTVYVATAEKPGDGGFTVTLSGDSPL